MKFNALLASLLLCTLSASFNTHSMQTDLDWDDPDFVITPPATTTASPVPVSKIDTHLPEAKPLVLLKPLNNTPTNRARELISLAQKFRHNEEIELDKTRILFNRAIDSAKDNPFVQAKAYQGLAKTYTTGDPKHALKLFDKAIQLAPKYPDFYFSAGDTAGFRLNNIELALEYFNKGFNRCVHNQTCKRSMYYASLGKLYLEIGDFVKAKKVYQEGLHFSNNNAHHLRACSHRFVGEACMALNQKKEAYDHLLEAIELTDPRAYNETLLAFTSFAQVLFAMGRKDEAQKTFDKALTYSKKFISSDRTRLPVFYDAYGCFLMDINEKEKAKQIFEEGIEECKNGYSYETSQLYKHYGMWLEEAHDLDAAKSAYKEGFKHAQKRKQAYCSELASKIATIWRKQGNEEKAKKYESKAAGLQEKSVQLKP